MAFRSYVLHLVVNGFHFNKVEIDNHYEKAHADHMNDKIILELARGLNHQVFEPVKEYDDGLKVFVTEPLEWNHKPYRLVWFYYDQSHDIESANSLSRKETKMKRTPASQQLTDMDKLAKGKLYSSVLPTNAPLADQLKHDLCQQIIIYKHKKGLKQKELGKLLGVHEARVSEIVHFKIDKFTADKLMAFLEMLNPRAHVKVS